MDERLLFKAALGASLLGIFLLLIAGELGGPSEVNLSEVAQREGQAIAVRGTVRSLRETPSAFLFQLEEGPVRVDVVAYKQEENKLREGLRVLVEGNVDAGGARILAERIQAS